MVDLLERLLGESCIHEIVVVASGCWGRPSSCVHGTASATLSCAISSSVVRRLSRTFALLLEAQARGVGDVGGQQQVGFHDDGATDGDALVSRPYGVRRKRIPKLG